MGRDTFQVGNVALWHQYREWDREKRGGGIEERGKVGEVRSKHKPTLNEPTPTNQLLFAILSKLAAADV